MGSAKGSDIQRVPIVGSKKEIPTGSKEVGLVDPNEKIEVTVVLRPKSDHFLSADDLANTPPKERKYHSREEFNSSLGADPGDIGKVEEFARQHKLELIEKSVPKRTVKISGTAKQMQDVFGVTLKRYTHPKLGEFRGRSGEIFVPSELAELVVAVLGLDDRPQGRTHFRRFVKRKLGVKAAAASYYPPQVAKLYDYPQGADGSGQCVGIIELGGGDTAADLTAYFQKLGLPLPKITTVSVDGASNSPSGTSDGPDAEVMLDIEVAGSIAYGASIVVYFAPNTDSGFLDAITTAIHDSQNNPSVISISWGSGENEWTNQAKEAFNQAFASAGTLGVTICVASGDSGSSDGESDGLAHVDFPASSPYVLGCGGTRLLSSGGAITEETVWNDGANGGATGGGVSEYFPLPDWQSKASVPPSTNPGGKIGRGVPDVSGDADPSSGYIVQVDGEVTTIGGTSAVAPLWAALIALMNQKLGNRVGFVNPLLYTMNVSGAFHDITSGGNGAYSAKKGWDPCTGLGSPDGSKLLNSLSQ